MWNDSRVATKFLEGWLRGLSCITGYLKMGSWAALQDWAVVLDKVQCHANGKRKVGDGYSDLERCALLFALALPELFLGKQHPRAPLLHFSWVFCKLVTRMCPQSGFTIPAVHTGACSSCSDWIRMFGILYLQLVQKSFLKCGDVACLCTALEQ